MSKARVDNKVNFHSVIFPSPPRTPRPLYPLPNLSYLPKKKKLYSSPESDISPPPFSSKTNVGQPRVLLSMGEQSLTRYTSLQTE